MDAARQALEASGVWREEQPCFLQGEHARGLFRLAGIDDPVALYKGLLDAALCDMDNFSFQGR